MRPLAKACAALLFLVSVATVRPLAAQDSLVASGVNHFYNLEYDRAIADFTAAAQQNPDDAGIWNYLAQAILYNSMLRSGALESQLSTASKSLISRKKVEMTPAEDQSFSAALGKALAISQARLAKDANDADALYILGGEYALRANYEVSVRRGWVDALRDASRAREAHSRVCQLQPDNVDARLIPGFYDYVAGSLSGPYRILALLTGHRGDRERGIHTLETVAREGKSNRADAEFVLAAIYRREHRTKDAIPLIQDLIRQFPRSYLPRFELVDMFSEVGDAPSALQEVSRIRDLHREGAPGFAQLPPDKIEYLESSVLLRDQQFDHPKSRSANRDAVDVSPRQETN